jgi:hypothetical protein
MKETRSRDRLEAEAVIGLGGRDPVALEAMGAALAARPVARVDAIEEGSRQQQLTGVGALALDLGRRETAVGTRAVGHVHADARAGARVAPAQNDVAARAAVSERSRPVAVGHRLVVVGGAEGRWGRDRCVSDTPGIAG